MLISWLAFATAVVALYLRLSDVYEKWRTRRQAPALVPETAEVTALRDIAAAIREGRAA